MKEDKKYFYYKKKGNKTQYRLEDLGDGRIGPKDIYSTLIYLTKEYYNKKYRMRGSDLTIKQQEKFTIDKLNSNIHNAPNKNNKSYDIITKECIDFLLYITKKQGLNLYGNINQNNYSLKYKISNLDNDIDEYINWKYKGAYKIIKKQTIRGIIMTITIILLLIF